MDHFGIEQAMRGMAIGYFQASRRSGRTTSLVESLKAGDRVVCATSTEAKRLEALCRERDLKVRVIVIDPADACRIFEHEKSEGRTILDHSWVELYYMAALKFCAAGIDSLQRQSSGYGTAHIETRRQALEAYKWRL